MCRGLRGEERKKKKKGEDVSYLVWRIIGGSAPCLSSSDRKTSDSCRSMSRSPIYGWLLAEGDWSPAVSRRFNDGFAALLALIGREGANSSFRYGSIKVEWCLGWKTGSLQQKKPERKKNRNNAANEPCWWWYNLQQHFLYPSIK